MTAPGFSAVERFFMKVNLTPTCWLWTASTTQSGYGVFGTENIKVTTTAHRWSYSYFVGPIPDGYQVDHLCRVRRCVNPTHLEPVTQSENIRRAVAARRKAAEGRAA